MSWRSDTWGSYLNVSLEERAQRLFPGRTCSPVRHLLLLPLPNGGDRLAFHGSESALNTSGSANQGSGIRVHTGE